MTPRGSAVRIMFSDGSSFDVSPEVRSRHSLDPGRRLTADLLSAIREDAAAAEAEERAVRLLSRSRHTRQGIRLKLEQRGYSPAVVSRAVRRLVELGCLDDARAAEGWLRTRLERHPEGRAALLAGLLRHGVPRETAEQAVERALPAELEAEVARRLVRKLHGGAPPATEPERSRVLRRLLSRGFSRATARRALDGEGE